MNIYDIINKLLLLPDFIYQTMSNDISEQLILGIKDAINLKAMYKKKQSIKLEIKYSLILFTWVALIERVNEK